MRLIGDDLLSKIVNVRKPTAVAKNIFTHPSLNRGSIELEKTTFRDYLAQSFEKKNRYSGVDTETAYDRCYLLDLMLSILYLKVIHQILLLLTRTQLLIRYVVVINQNATEESWTGATIEGCVILFL